MHDNYLMTAILDQLKDMFTVKYSPVGSSSHKLEVDAFVMFMDYSYQCEKGNNINFMLKLCNGINFSHRYVVDITVDEEEDMPCADTEEGMLKSQTSLAVFYIQPSLFSSQKQCM